MTTRKRFDVMDRNGCTLYPLHGTEIHAVGGVAVLYDVNTNSSRPRRYVKAVIFENGHSVVEVFDVKSDDYEVLGPTGAA
jgi:hypothetical protein